MSFSCFLVGAMLLTGCPALAQAIANQTTPPPDSSRAVALPAATVVGYGQQRPWLRTAAAVGVLDAAALARFGPASPTAALNTLPGVRLEERATASYRLSIRGSTLRSPFGVRNVKVYYHDIPFTDASGSTPLNILDQSNFGRIEVLKGPAGSRYGAGTGGVLRLENQRPAPGRSGGDVGFVVGSFGLQRRTATAETSGPTATGPYLRVHYARQTLDGYRANSALRRDVLALDGAAAITPNQTLTAHLLYSDLDYQLPGGLTRAQFGQDPRQARPGTATQPGTVAQRAYYASQTALLGLTHTSQLADRWTSTVTLFGSGAVINTPYLVDFERSTQLGGGGRASLNYRTALAGQPLQLAVGGEGQVGFESSRSYQNRGGTPGPLRYDDETGTRTGFGFAQAEMELPARFLLTVGASYNGLRYHNQRLAADSTISGRFDLTRRFQPEILPRVALLKTLTANSAAYASVSTGFSPPTAAEIRTSDGGLNQDLQAEHGTSYELGLRGAVLHQRLAFDVTAFDLELRETIVSRSNAQGTQLFANVGRTHQRGLEVALSGWLWRPGGAAETANAAVQPPTATSAAPGLRAWVSYAYNHFRFGSYPATGGPDPSGNRLTGTAPHTLSAGLDGRLPAGFGLFSSLSQQAAVPLDDANTTFSTGYWTFGGRASWQRLWPHGFRTELYAGADNLTDRQYSLGYDLNAFGGRYFQPAPGRSWYVGAALSYRL